ncbi:MAG: hypothetical protein R3F62_03245 [Planctomycetota bacterium]
MADYYAFVGSWRFLRRARGVRGKLSLALTLLAKRILDWLGGGPAFAISYDLEPTDREGVPAAVREEAARRSSELEGFGEPLWARLPTLGDLPTHWAMFRVSADATTRASLLVTHDLGTGAIGYLATTFVSEVEGEPRWLITTDLEDEVSDRVPEVDLVYLRRATPPQLWIQHQGRVRSRAVLPQRADEVFARSRDLDRAMIAGYVSDGALVLLEPEWVNELVERLEKDPVTASAPEPGSLHAFSLIENETHLTWRVELTEEHLRLIAPAASEPLLLPRAETDACLELSDGIVLKTVRFPRGDFPGSLFLAERPGFRALQDWAGPPGEATVRRAIGSRWRPLYEVPWGLMLCLGALAYPADAWVTLQPAWLARSTQLLVGGSLLLLTAASAVLTHRVLILLHTVWLTLLGVSLALRTWSWLGEVPASAGWFLAGVVWLWATLRLRTYLTLLGRD